MFSDVILSQIPKHHYYPLPFLPSTFRRSILLVVAAWAFHIVMLYPMLLENQVIFWWTRYIFVPSFLLYKMLFRTCPLSMLSSGTVLIVVSSIWIFQIMLFCQLPLVLVALNRVLFCFDSYHLVDLSSICPASFLVVLTPVIYFNIFYSISPLLPICMFSDSIPNVTPGAFY